MSLIGCYLRAKIQYWVRTNQIHASSVWRFWRRILGPVYTDTVSFVTASFSMRQRLPFTRRRWKIAAKSGENGKFVFVLKLWNRVLLDTVWKSRYTCRFKNAASDISRALEEKRLFNHYTPSRAKFKTEGKILNFILQNWQKQTVPHESTAQ